MRTVWKAVSTLAIVYLVLVAGPYHAYQLAGWDAATMWLVFVCSAGYALGRIEEHMVAIRQTIQKSARKGDGVQVQNPTEWHFTGDYWQAFQREEATQ